VTACFFVSDLHGRIDRYEKLFRILAAERPGALFFGGDFLPHGRPGKPVSPTVRDFIRDYLSASWRQLRRAMGESFPRIFLIMGNDDRRAEEPAVLETELLGLWSIFTASEFLSDDSRFTVTLTFRRLRFCSRIGSATTYHVTSIRGACPRKKGDVLSPRMNRSEGSLRFRRIWIAWRAGRRSARPFFYSTRRLTIRALTGRVWRV